MSNLKLVAIDDEASFLHLIAEFGRLQGFEVACFSGWSEDVKSFVGFADVLLLDMQMPETDGLDVLAELSDAGYDGSIVFISGVAEVMLDYAVKYASSKGLNPVGFLQKPFGLEDFSKILKKCESEKFEGKENTQPFRAAVPEMGAEELQRAMLEEWFFPVFQPQINSQTGEIVGIECLARMEHPTLGIVPPVRFIGELEETYLINVFTEKLVQLALAQTLELLDSHETMTISFNISSKTLNQDTAIRLVDIIKASHARPEQIVFEVTETSAIDISEETEFALTKLRLFGVGLSIDDFGTGYSTISQINKLPFNELKVDRSFVMHIGDKQTSRAIVASTCQLAQSLDYKLIAEGVENEEQLEFLKEHNCFIIQGYLYSKPLKIEQLKQFVLDFESYAE